MLGCGKRRDCHSLIEDIGRVSPDFGEFLRGFAGSIPARFPD
jgi:hypothetical protein